MSRIDFYIIPDTSENARLTIACRLIEKAYKQKHRVYIHVENQTTAHRLDEKLWTYREDSFIPHNLYGEGSLPAPPIQIGYQIVPENHRDILINLDKEVPAFYSRFTRVLELVSSDPIIQANSRDHYRVYRKNGHNILTHTLSSIEAC